MINFKVNDRIIAFLGDKWYNGVVLDHTNPKYDEVYDVWAIGYEDKLLISCPGFLNGKPKVVDLSILKKDYSELGNLLYE